MTDPQAYTEAAARVRSYDAEGRHRSVRLSRSTPSDATDAHAEIRARIEALRDQVLGQFADPTRATEAGTDSAPHTEPPHLDIP